MTDIPVTTVTRNATYDSLSDQDYRDIYDELREYDAPTNKYAISLDDFVAMTGSQFSKASWSKYHTGQRELNRVMRNELRAAVGQPVLPPTITEAVSDVNPDAEVIQIGEEVPNRLFMVGTRKNLLITLADQWAVSPVTPVTSPLRIRKRVERPWITEEQAQARIRLGKSWKEIIDAGLKALESSSAE